MKTSPASRRAIWCYIAGLVLLSATLIITDALNPRGIRNGSRFEPFFLPLAVCSLALCITAPFLSSRPLAHRFGFLVIGLFGFGLICVACWTISFHLFGASPF